MGPVIAKPQLAETPVFESITNLKSCAHSFYILPKASMICDALSSFKSENEQKTYVKHNGCHKVYAVDDNVFATVNDSTPKLSAIDDARHTFIDTGKYSKKPLADQNDKKLNDNLYQALSMRIKELFELDCFGYDLLFDDELNQGYIVDLNFLPGY